MTTVIKSRAGSGSDNIVFSSPHLVLVEGVDDQAVISGLIIRLGLNGFQVYDMNGKDDWQRRIRVISKGPDFQTNIKSLGLVRDADSNPNGTWDSCTSALRNAGLPIPAAPITGAAGPPQTNILIVPSRTEHGAIEELCLKSFDSGRLTCVNGYFDCLSIPAANRKKKGLVQVYLGGLDEPVRDLTLAVAKNRLDLDHAVFEDARQFLRFLAAT